MQSSETIINSFNMLEKDITNEWGDNLIKYEWDGPVDPDKEIEDL